MDLLEDWRMASLNFNFVMIHIVHKILIKNCQNYLKDNVFECVFKKYTRLLFTKKNILFFIIYNNGKFKSWRRIHNGRYKKPF